MKRAVYSIGGPILALMLWGCGNGGFKDDGVPDSYKSQASDANALAKSVDGNYDKLTPAQKSSILSLANGNEKQARTLFYYMAHPPGETSHIPSGPPK